MGGGRRRVLVFGGAREGMRGRRRVSCHAIGSVDRIVPMTPPRCSFLEVLGGLLTQTAVLLWSALPQRAATGLGRRGRMLYSR